MRSVDVRKVHSVDIDRRKEDTVLIDFTYEKNNYCLLAKRENNKWCPKNIYDFRSCDYCKANGIDCTCFDECVDELFQVIEKSIRLKLLFD